MHTLRTYDRDPRTSACTNPGPGYKGMCVRVCVSLAIGRTACCSDADLRRAFSLCMQVIACITKQCLYVCVCVCVCVHVACAQAHSTLLMLSREQLARALLHPDYKRYDTPGQGTWLRSLYANVIPLAAVRQSLVRSWTTSPAPVVRHTHTHTHRHTHTHACTHTHIHTQTYTHTPAWHQVIIRRSAGSLCGHTTHAMPAA